MNENATGLILRVRPLTETSLIVQWLTPNLGRLATVAKGARRSRSPFGGKLDLFYLADFSFSRSRRSELHTLVEVSLRETHAGLRRELPALQQAAYCAQLVEQTTESETPLPVIFELAVGLLGCLVTRPPSPQTIFAFEIKLLNELGLTPGPGECALSPGASQLISAYAQADWPFLSQLKPSEAQIGELGRFLERFLLFHVGRIPKGRAAALGRKAKEAR